MKTIGQVITMALVFLVFLQAVSAQESECENYWDCPWDYQRNATTQPDCQESIPAPSCDGTSEITYSCEGEDTLIKTVHFCDQSCVFGNETFEALVACGYEQPPDVVPEFSGIAAGIAIAGAGLAYLALRRR